MDEIEKSIELEKQKSIERQIRSSQKIMCLFSKQSLNVDNIIATNALEFTYRGVRNLGYVVGDTEFTNRITPGKYFITVISNKNSLEETIYKIEDKNLILMLFNKNSVHLINNGNLMQYPTSIKKVEDFIDSVIVNRFDLSQFYLDSTAALGLYGLRPTGDLDFLTACSGFECIEIKDEVEINFKYINYHTCELHELLNHPEKYLIYKGVKVISLSELIAWKTEKGAPKDIEDVKLIQLFLNRDKRYKTFRNYVLLKRNTKILLYRIYRLIFKEKRN